MMAWMFSSFADLISIVNTTLPGTILVAPGLTFRLPTVATVPSPASFAIWFMPVITLAASTSASALISIGVVPAWSGLPVISTS